MAKHSVRETALLKDSAGRLTHMLPTLQPPEALRRLFATARFLGKHGALVYTLVFDLVNGPSVISSTAKKAVKSSCLKALGREAHIKAK